MVNVMHPVCEKTGVNRNQLVELLIRNAATELTTFDYYTILREKMTGSERAAFSEMAETARMEDRIHYEALVPRIAELGGKLPEDRKAFRELAACPPAGLPRDTKDVPSMLTALVVAERCAVRAYTRTCNLTAGKDNRTNDLCLAILHEELEHESWFSEYLTDGLASHFLRRGETSPFVSKFLK